MNFRQIKLKRIILDLEEILEETSLFSETEQLRKSIENLKEIELHDYD